MDLIRIAEKEGTDVQQIFVRASRLFVKGPANPTGDYERWKQGLPNPSYIQEYVRYWNGLNRTETHNDRRH